jgi:hypothetical protein
MRPSDTTMAALTEGARLAKRCALPPSASATRDRPARAV